MKKILLVVISIMFISGLFLVAVQAEESALDKASAIEATDPSAAEVKEEAAEEIKEEAAESATDEAAEEAGELKDITEDAEKAQEDAGSK